MVEAAPQPLAAVLGPHVGAWFAQLHRAEGVEVLTGRTLRGVSGNGAVTGLELSDGRRIAVDHVVVGVGVDPDAHWLGGHGPHVQRRGARGRLRAHEGRRRVRRRRRRGQLRRRRPGAGPPARIGRPRRARVPGPPERCWASIPVQSAPAGFWSDQYGIRIQYLGRARPDDAVAIDGDPEARDFTATFSRGGRAVAVLLVNRSRGLPAARALIEKGTT